MKLFDLINNGVIPTKLSRKLTINGETKAYPVYKINIDLLYYNNQNDRIATWISQYSAAHGENALESLEHKEYNDIIEKFIVSSNPSSIEKTQMNISIVGQREPGVVLNDGRIIDGNRRFTCIRRINKTNPETKWFEAVILDMDINNNKKMIKMLELSIQHGEEQRVDYNKVEKLIGVYHDIVETELLTPEEYAESTNEPLIDVKRRIELSKLLIEFLDFIGLPKQYHVAREYQIAALLSDLFDVLKKCNNETKERVKKVVFTNIMMETIGEERKYTKNISNLISNGRFDEFYDSQDQIIDKINERINGQKPDDFLQLKSFVRNSDDLQDELKESIDEAVLGAKKEQIRNKPAQNVTKCISQLKDIDLNILDKLNTVEKEKLINQTSKLFTMVNTINKKATGEELATKPEGKKGNDNIKITITPSSVDELLNVSGVDGSINNLIKQINISANSSGDYILMFVDKNYDICSNIITKNLDIGVTTLTFTLESKITELKEVYLLIKKDGDLESTARQLIKFSVNIEFSGDFGF